MKRLLCFWRTRNTKLGNEPNISQPPQSDAQNTKTEGDEDGPDIGESFSRIFCSAEFSDLKISCGSMLLDVHKAIICPKSAFFAAACRKSSGFKEAQTGTINLEDDDPDAVRMMIHYLYHFDYPIVDTNVAVPDITPKLHAKVYALGEKYGIPRLKDLAAKKFNDTAQAVDPEPLLDGIFEAYTSTIDTDRDLRDVAANAVFGRADLLDSPEIQEKIQELPQLNMDLLILYRKQQKGS